jgi:hypothetical protein
MLALPTLAAAQAVNPTDLVGSWAQDSAKQLGWTFRADSTVSIASKIPQGPLTASGRWTLSGDTLSVRVMSAKVKGQRAQVQIAKRKVEVASGKLTLTRLDNHQTVTYEKVDSLVSPAPAPAPMPMPSGDSSMTPKP